MTRIEALNKIADILDEGYVSPKIEFVIGLEESEFLGLKEELIPIMEKAAQSMEDKKDELLEIAPEATMETPQIIEVDKDSYKFKWNGYSFVIRKYIKNSSLYQLLLNN